MIFDWPDGLGTRGVAFNQRGMTIAGARTITGHQQVVSSDAGYWIALYSGVPVAGPARILKFRALRALLEGGSHGVRVPSADWQQAPWPGGVIVQSPTPILFDDDAEFDDGTGFAQPTISVAAAVAAEQGTTMVVADVLNAGSIEPGMYFSVGDRLYVIKAILDVTGAQQTFAIWPRLREEVPAGTELNFDRPVCRMRLASDAEMDLLLDYGRVGIADIGFVELR